MTENLRWALLALVFLTAFTAIGAYAVINRYYIQGCAGDTCTRMDRWTGDVTIVPSNRESTVPTQADGAELYDGPVVVDPLPLDSAEIAQRALTQRAIEKILCDIGRTPPEECPPP